jgi:hypothetical protein
MCWLLLLLLLLLLLGVVRGTLRCGCKVSAVLFAEQLLQLLTAICQTSLHACSRR